MLEERRLMISLVTMAMVETAEMVAMVVMV